MTVLLDPFLLFMLLASPFVGSFLALLAVRLPKGEQILWGRSRCDDCAVALGVLDLVPILSWFWLKGHCRHCGKPFGLLPLLLEVAAVLIALWAALALPDGLAAVSMILGWGLLVHAATDLRRYYLSPLLSVCLIALGLAIAYSGSLDQGLWHLLGAGTGWLGFFVIDWLYQRWRGRPGLGGGDALLFAAGGAWVGLAALPSLLLTATLPALAFAFWRLRSGGKGRQRVPFGAFLAFSIWLTWLYGPFTWS